MGTIWTRRNARVNLGPRRTSAVIISSPEGPQQCAHGIAWCAFRRQQILRFAGFGKENKGGSGFSYVSAPVPRPRRHGLAGGLTPDSRSALPELTTLGPASWC